MKKDHDLVKFTAMLIRVGTIYGKDISELLVDLYWQALKCFEWQEVKCAVNTHIHNADNGQYFPKPADLVKLIEGSSETKAFEAWAKVAKVISRIGAYHSVVFDDPLIHAVLEELGGWVTLCRVTIKELQFFADRFQKRYMVLVNNAPKNYPKYCGGILEAVNTINGDPTGSVLLIGDPKKAKQVMQTGSDVAVLISKDVKTI